MTNSPLWLCLKIQGGKERKGHELFVRHFISSLPPLTQTVRVNRHHRTAAQRTVERTLLPGYAFVARDHSEPASFEGRLLRLRWPASDTPVIHRVVGWVRHDTIMDLVDAADAAAIEPSPALLKAGDKARILLAGDLREVIITVVKGKRVRVMLDGREISTQVDKLEAA